MDESSLEARSMKAGRYLARRRFRFDRDRETKIIDVQHVAWQFAQEAPPEATATAVAKYAVRYVASGRHFGRSIRSIDGPTTPLVEKPERQGFNLESLSRPGDDPAEIACFRLTFVPWLLSLPERKLLVALALLLGDTTGAAARQFNVSKGRISQIRSELKTDWEACTA